MFEVKFFLSVALAGGQLFGLKYLLKIFQFLRGIDVY